MFYETPNSIIKLIAHRTLKIYCTQKVHPSSLIPFVDIFLHKKRLWWWEGAEGRKEGDDKGQMVGWHHQLHGHVGLSKLRRWWRAEKLAWGSHAFAKVGHNWATDSSNLTRSTSAQYIHSHRLTAGELSAQPRLGQSYKTGNDLHMARFYVWLSVPRSTVSAAFDSVNYSLLSAKHLALILPIAHSLAFPITCYAIHFTKTLSSFPAADAGMLGLIFRRFTFCL